MHEQGVRRQPAVDRGQPDREREETDDPEPGQYKLSSPPVDPGTLSRPGAFGGHRSALMRSNVGPRSARHNGLQDDLYDAAVHLWSDGGVSG